MARRNIQPVKNPAALYYLASVKRSFNRLDEPGFSHYNLKLTDSDLIRYLLAKAYIEKRYVPDMVANLIIKGLKSDKTYQEYTNQDLDLSINQTTSMSLQPRRYCADKQLREQGHSSITGLNK